MQEKTNVPGLVGFVVSLVGFFIFPIVLGIIGLIASGMGLDEIKYEKRGLAIAGLIISVINIIFGIIKWIM